MLQRKQKANRKQTNTKNKTRSKVEAPMQIFFAIFHQKHQN